MSSARWDVPRMRRLVEEWDRFVVGDRYITSDPWRREVLQAGSALRPPATEEQLVVAEDRLGVRLPPSYRAFLLISNGAFAGPLGTDRAGDDPTGYLPIEQVDPMPRAHSTWVELWCSHDWPKSQPPAPGEPADGADFQRGRQGLLISNVSEVFFDMLVPAEQGEEWQLWSTAKEGATVHYSFADALLMQMRYRREPPPDPLRRQEYVDRAETGDRWALVLLAELDPGRASEVASHHLDDAQQRWEIRGHAALLLARLTAAGLAAGLPDLRRVRSYDGPTMRTHLLEARAVAGDPEAVDELHVAARGPDQNNRTRAARRVLAQLG